MLEISKHRIDICSLAETKKKGKGTLRYEEYIMFYSGKDKNQRAHSGVGVLLHEKFEEYIDSVQYFDETMIQVTLKFERDTMNIISVYAPDINKPRAEREEFFEKLQDTLDKILKNEKIFLMGDLNSRIGNTIVPGVMQKFNEDVVNNNGEMLLTICAHNELRINNTYFDHKPQYKYTFNNSRGQRSTIDFVITNRKVHPTEVLDVRVLASANATTDHGLVLCKYRMKVSFPKKKPPQYTFKFNIESMKNDSTTYLYQKRLAEKISINPVEEHDDVNQAWEKIKLNIIQSATEAIGIRKVNISGKKNNKPWFTEEVKELANEKREAYKKYRNKKTPEEYANYKEVRNRVNQSIKELKEQYWENFSVEMQHDLYGGQKKIWNMIRNRKKATSEEVQIGTISPEKWTTYFKDLYKNRIEDEIDHQDTSEINDASLEQNHYITFDDVLSSVSSLKNRKAPGIDNISNEMIKYGGLDIAKEITKLLEKTIQTGKIPEEWRTSVTIPIFKKGSKRDPKNYRGITLLSAVLKILTKIVSQKLTETVRICEEQQGFRKNRSTVDAIFIIRQLTEKAIEFDKPMFLCFVDMKQAFDRVLLSDVINILQDCNVDGQYIKIIKDLNKDSKTRIRVSNSLTEEIHVNVGIRQGDSLSPTLFNIVMNEIIRDVEEVNAGYRMGDNSLKILCYADDAVLAAENEDDLQRLLYRFKIAAEKFNMIISIEKTKSMVISRDPIRCKLAVDNNTIEQVMKFNYLGSQISSSRNLTEEVRENAIKASRISGSLREVIWRNRYMSIESKTRIYKTCVRPIIAYAAETRAETSKTKQLMRASEMRTLRAIKGVSLRDRIHSSAIREECQTEDIVRWVRSRRRQWRDHVDRMDTARLANWARTKKPETTRPPGRPPKRWTESWTSASQEA